MAQQQIDLDSDGMGDVWEQFFNATSLNPGGDEDFDGYSNLDESLAGTDPFDADSAPGFSEYDASGGEREDFRWHHHDGDPDCGHR